MANYQYALRSRPFGIGTYPTENFKGWEPSETYPFGILNYSEPLTFERWGHFSLMPLSRLKELEGMKINFFADMVGAVSYETRKDGQICGVKLNFMDEGEKDYHLLSVGDFLKNIESGRYKIIQ